MVQARSVNKKVAELGPIDLIVTSPLTRAMDTMQLAFAGVDAPKVRPVKHSCDFFDLRFVVGEGWDKGFKGCQTGKALVWQDRLEAFSLTKKNILPEWERPDRIWDDPLLRERPP